MKVFFASVLVVVSGFAGDLLLASFWPNAGSVLATAAACGIILYNLKRKNEEDE